ncbi:hypothetical protein GVAV_001922 [Gurleya vavrai]
MHGYFEKIGKNVETNIKEKNMNLLMENDVLTDKQIIFNHNVSTNENGICIRSKFNLHEPVFTESHIYIDLNDAKFEIKSKKFNMNLNCLSKSYIGILMKKGNFYQRLFGKVNTEITVNLHQNFTKQNFKEISNFYSHFNRNECVILDKMKKYSRIYKLIDAFAIDNKILVNNMEVDLHKLMSNYEENIYENLPKKSMLGSFHIQILDFFQRKIFFNVNNIGFKNTKRRHIFKNVICINEELGLILKKKFNDFKFILNANEIIFYATENGIESFNFYYNKKTNVNDICSTAYFELLSERIFKLSHLIHDLKDLTNFDTTEYKQINECHLNILIKSLAMLFYNNKRLTPKIGNSKKLGELNSKISYVNQNKDHSFYVKFNFCDKLLEAFNVFNDDFLLKVPALSIKLENSNHFIKIFFNEFEYKYNNTDNNAITKSIQFKINTNYEKNIKGTYHMYNDENNKKICFLEIDDIIDKSTKNSSLNSKITKNLSLDQFQFNKDSNTLDGTGKYIDKNDLLFVKFTKYLLNALKFKYNPQKITYRFVLTNFVPLQIYFNDCTALNIYFSNISILGSVNLEKDSCKFDYNFRLNLSKSNHKNSISSVQTNVHPFINLILSKNDANSPLKHALNFVAKKTILFYLKLPVNLKIKSKNNYYLIVTDKNNFELITILNSSNQKYNDRYYIFGYINSKHKDSTKWYEVHKKFTKLYYDNVQSGLLKNKETYIFLYKDKEILYDTKVENIIVHSNLNNAILSLSLSFLQNHDVISHNLLSNLHWFKNPTDENSNLYFNEQNIKETEKIIEDLEEKSLLKKNHDQL